MCTLPGGHAFGPLQRGDQFLQNGFCLCTTERVLLDRTGQPFADSFNGDPIRPLDVRWGGIVEVVSTQDLRCGLLDLAEVAYLGERVMQQASTVCPGEGGSTGLHKNIVGGILVLMRIGVA